MRPVCRFRETTFELLGGVAELNFDHLNLGDDGAVQLAVVLPLCAKLTKLHLRGTELGDKGAAALAGAIKGNRVVKRLFLNGNDIGDALGYHVRGAVSIPGSYAGLLRPIGHLVVSLCHIFTREHSFLLKILWGN